MFEPRYLITHGILRNVGQIDAAREMIRHAALVPNYEKQFREDAMVRSVHHGTKIEGNDLSYDQAKKIVLVEGKSAYDVSQKTGVIGRDRDIQEVINYREVLKWIDRWGTKLKKPVSYSQDILKTIHQMTVANILDEKDSGDYRRVQVAIKNSKTGEVTFMPPPAVEVPYQVEDFFTWLNSDEGRMHHPILRAGITHYELVRIHPFVDGNGRTARALAMMVLHAENYDIKRFFSLEEYFDNDAMRYYEALASVGEGDAMDLTYWLEYFTIGLASELQKIEEQVLKLSKDQKFKGSLGAQIALSERQIKIIEAMQKGEGMITTGDANELLPMISPDTVLRELKDLITKGVIKKKGKTKGAYYELKS